MRRLLLVVLLLMLTVSVACGAEDEVADDGDSQELVTASTEAPAATETAEPPPPTPESTPTPEPGPRTVSVVGQDGALVMGTDGTPWWNDTTFYEIFVRSFYDSDGDGIGDLQGVIEKLDYLNDGDPTTDHDLGVTGIWLMPITDATSYHGYDTIDYRAIDPDYGTIEDFQALMDAAHERGIRIIVDLVVNHTGREHPWFEASQDPASEFRDWYIWEAEDPGYAGPEGQKVWHRGAEGYYYGVFWDGMPDLDFTNPDVTAEMYGVTRYWLEEMGADGFRLDAIKHLVEKGPLQENTAETYAWWSDYYNFYKEVDPQAFTVGEAWSPTSFVARYIGDGVDIAFEFDLAVALMTSASTGLNIGVTNAMEAGAGVYPMNQYATFLTNHDQNRVMSQLDGEIGPAKMAAAMLLTGPGVPFIYYGEEIGMEGTKPDEQIRRPMQWTPEPNKGGFSTAIPWQLLDGNHREVNVQLQDEDPESLLNHYRALIDLRNEHEAIRIGEYAPLETDNIRLYAFLRWSDEEQILVLMNLSDREITAEDYVITRPDGPLENLESAWLLLGGEAEVTPPTVTAEGGVEAYTPFETIPPYTTYVIQLQ